MTFDVKRRKGRWPLRGSSRALKGFEGVPHLAFLGITLISASMLLMVAGFLIFNSLPAFRTIGLDEMLLGTTWDPTSSVKAAYGMLPLLGGTFLVSLLASLIAIPIGIGCTIYLAEIAHPRVRAFLKPAIELLAGIPSVVYGLFALLILQNWVAALFGIPTGYVALDGGIILAVMMIPIMVTLSEDAIAAVPRELREASYALGATRWETMRSVVLPAALSGIVAAIILSVMRAVGETMAVLMAVSQTPLLTLDPLSGVQTMTATIAIEMGEVAVGSIHYSALFAVGVILFVITLAMNTVADIIMLRYSEAYH
ncbi:MAG: phosphate ABC transporter permease subunit PstC [Methanomassiliicoccus sp.]|nr:phosphate ABC transporter permease subunit PstC [Methanomassiliicoccus sp.]